MYSLTNKSKSVVLSKNRRNRNENIKMDIVDYDAGLWLKRCSSRSVF